MGNSHAHHIERLEEGKRYEKAGLNAKALEVYRSVRSECEDPEIQARAWREEAFAHHGCGAWEEALGAAAESARLAVALKRDDLLAEALNAEAAVYFSRGSMEKALPLYEEMLALTDEPRIRGFAYQNLGILHAREGDPDEAERRLEEAYEEFDRAGHGHGKAHVQNNRAAVSLDRGRFEDAEEFATRAMALARDVDDLDLLAIATLNRAEALERLDRVDEAEAAASVALGQFGVSGNRWRRVACLRMLGDLNHRLGEHDTARRFWARALELARDIGAALDAEELEDRLETDHPPFPS
jgi:tetratricopeptide (TPR) repeat protein